MARQPNPTPPAKYPSIADIKRLHARLNTAEIARAAGLNRVQIQTLLQYDREPPAEVYKPLRKALLTLRRDIDKALGSDSS
ncbi:MAG: hypothetical protein AAFU38_08650 [Bacteroidota bacterium]